MRTFDPDKYPNICFANWFSKQDAETLCERKLTDDDWARICYEGTDAIADEVSEIFSIWLKEWLNRMDSEDVELGGGM